jgi:hypothetical protein
MRGMDVVETPDFVLNDIMMRGHLAHPDKVPASRLSVSTCLCAAFTSCEACLPG